MKDMSGVFGLWAKELKNLLYRLWVVHSERTQSGAETLSKKLPGD